MSKDVFATSEDRFINSHLVEEMVKRGKRVSASAYYNSFNS